MVSEATRREPQAGLANKKNIKLMKTKILLVAALIGAAALSTQAGISFGFSFGLPVVAAPMVVAAPGPVVVAAPVYGATVCPGPGYAWVPGYWSVGIGGRLWVPGCWRGGYGHCGYGYYGHGAWGGGYYHGGGWGGGGYHGGGWHR